MLAPSCDVYGPGGLAGGYLGATAEAPIAVSIGANTLVGRLSRSITLQPLNLQTKTGLNATIAISALQLTVTLK